MSQKQANFFFPLRIAAALFDPGQVKTLRLRKGGQNVLAPSPLWILRSFERLKIDPHYAFFRGEFCKSALIYSERPAIAQQRGDFLRTYVSRGLIVCGRLGLVQPPSMQCGPTFPLFRVTTDVILEQCVKRLHGRVDKFFISRTLQAGRRNNGFAEKELSASVSFSQRDHRKDRRSKRGSQTSGAIFRGDAVAQKVDRALRSVAPWTVGTRVSLNTEPDAFAPFQCVY